MARSDIPENLRAEPMTYERRHLSPSIRRQQINLAARADNLTAEELRAQAEAAQIPLKGTTKAAMLESVRGAVQTPTPTTEEG